MLVTVVDNYIVNQYNQTKLAPSNTCNRKCHFPLPTQAGNYVRDDVVSSTIQLILNSPPEEQAYIGLRLWDSLHNITNSYEDKQPLLQVAIWTIGEYGDLMLSSERIEGIVVDV